MSEFQVNIYNIIYLLTIAGFIFSALILSEKFRKRFFAFVFSSSLFKALVLKRYFEEHRRFWLKEFTEFKKLDNKEKLIILEIGIGSGGNFQYYPNNCRLIAVDYNENFKNDFMNTLKDYPNIEFDSYVNQCVEDMSQIDDNSVDVVLTTHVFCSVKNVEKGLSEIKRVLKQGGTYFFFEHVAYSYGVYQFLQNLINPIWMILGGNCHLNRKLWFQYEKAGFKQIQIKHSYPQNIPFILRHTIYGNAQN